MEKSLFSRSYTTFLRHLRTAREEASLTQGDLAKRLRKTRSFAVSANAAKGELT
jgi:hypothetical protein